MANLLTANDKVGLTGALGDHFDTFKREIVIFKEPIKVINNVTSNNSYAGYGESSNQVEFTYVPVSGVYSGIVSYYEDQQSELGEAVGNLFLGQGKVKILKNKDEMIQVFDMELGPYARTIVEEEVFAIETSDHF